MLLLQLRFFCIFLRPKIGDECGEVNGELLPSKWLPESLNKFFAARIGDDIGEKCFLLITGESVFGETDRLVTTGESVGEEPERILQEAELGSDLDLVLCKICTSGWSNPVAEIEEKGECSSSPLLLLAPV